MRKGDLITARWWAPAMLYIDNDAQLPKVGPSEDWLSSNEGEIMIVIGKGRFKHVRVHHPIHGPCRVHRDRIIVVVNESR